MKKLLLVLVLVLFPGLASAHVLQTDGNIGAVLHIDPSDDPVATQSSGFYFDFQDKSGKFQLTNCSCTVVIHQGDQQLDSEQLSLASLTTASFTYTFPAKGVYQVHVIGVPKTTDAFQPFSLVYTIRVERDTGDTKSGVPDWVWALVVAGVVVILTGAGVSAKRASAQPKRR
jgi:hypothetical protein